MGIIYFSIRLVSANVRQGVTLTANVRTVEVMTIGPQ